MALSHAEPPELQLGPSTAAWFAVFIVTCACLRRRSFDFNNRLVSLLHALISSGVAIYYVAMRPLSIGAPSTPGQTFTLTLSCGYFLYDFIIATVYETVHGR
jgi:TLC domain